MMLKSVLSAGLCAVLIMAAPALAQTAQETPDARILKRDFARMMEWFPGVYDNQEQVYFQDEMDVPEDVRHNRIHHIFAPVKLDNFPGTTFYVQQSQNDDPTDIYRQRIYSFEADNDENAVRLTIYAPNDASKLVDAHLKPDLLATLKPSQFVTYPGCEVFWKAESNYFHGYMKKDACKVESKRSGRTLIIEDDLQLTENELWIRDEAKDTDGNYVYGNKAGVHHKNRKARRFTCWVSVKKEDGSFTFDNNLEIHDQGGRIWIEAVEGEHKRVGLKMRNVVWPYGRNKPSLVLYAYHGEDADRAVSYAWANPEADRIGLNLRFAQGSCTLDENGFF